MYERWTLISTHERVKKQSRPHTLHIALKVAVVHPDQDRDKKRQCENTCKVDQERTRTDSGD